MMELKWKDDAQISVSIEPGLAVLKANRDGLLSLASQLTALAGERPGSHIHYDEYNALAEGSAQLIVELSGA